jgi:hypothetical protein
MRELTHPVELRDEELDFVAAAGGSLVDLDVDVDVEDNQTNISVINTGFLKQEND